MGLAEFKLESALQDLLQANATISALIVADSGRENAFDVYTAIDDGTIDFDCIVVMASASESRIPQDGLIGNWDVTFTVKLFTNIRSDDVGRADHITRAQAIDTVLFDDGIKASINAISAGLVLGNPVPQNRNNAIQNDCWTHEITMTVPCRDGD